MPHLNFYFIDVMLFIHMLLLVTSTHNIQYKQKFKFIYKHNEGLATVG